MPASGSTGRSLHASGPITPRTGSGRTRQARSSKPFSSTCRTTWSSCSWSTLRSAHRPNSSTRLSLTPTRAISSPPTGPTSEFARRAEFLARDPTAHRKADSRLCGPARRMGPWAVRRAGKAARRRTVLLVAFARGLDLAGGFGQAPRLVARGEFLLAGAQRTALGLERLELLARRTPLDRLFALGGGVAGGLPAAALGLGRLLLLFLSSLLDR